MAFFVGQKVVCIRECTSGWEWRADGGWDCSSPVYLATYTVRDLEYFEDMTWLIFEEMVVNQMGQRQAFMAFGLDGVLNFRPVVERKTSIEIFERLLAPSDMETV